MSVIPEPVSKPAKMSPRDKASMTNDAARQIIAAEVAERERKTERLRAMRLATEAEAAQEKLAEPARATKKAVKDKS